MIYLKKNLKRSFEAYVNNSCAIDIILCTLKSGGCRISPRWGCQPSRRGANLPGGAPTYDFANYFQKTAWNWKNLDREEGGVQNSTCERYGEGRHLDFIVLITVFRYQALLFFLFFLQILHPLILTRVTIAKYSFTPPVLPLIFFCLKLCALISIVSKVSTLKVYKKELFSSQSKDGIYSRHHPSFENIVGCHLSLMLCFNPSCRKQWIQDFRRWGRQPFGGSPTYDFANFSKHCMKLKEFGPRGEVRVPIKSANRKIKRTRERLMSYVLFK